MYVKMLLEEVIWTCFDGYTKMDAHGMKMFAPIRQAWRSCNMLEKMGALGMKG